MRCFIKKTIQKHNSLRLIQNFLRQLQDFTLNEVVTGIPYAEEVEGVHEYHKLANSMEEQGHPDLAHRLRNMTEDEHRHSEELQDMLNQLA